MQMTMRFEGGPVQTDLITSLMAHALQTASARQSWNDPSDAAAFCHYVLAVARTAAQIDAHRDQMPIHAQTFVDDIGSAVEAFLRHEEMALASHNVSP